MQHTYELIKNILALIGACSVSATLAIGGFIIISYVRDRKR